MSVFPCVQKFYEPISTANYLLSRNFGLSQKAQPDFCYVAAPIKHKTATT